MYLLVKRSFMLGRTPAKNVFKGKLPEQTFYHGFYFSGFNTSCYSGPTGARRGLNDKNAITLERLKIRFANRHVRLRPPNLDQFMR